MADERARPEPRQLVRRPQDWNAERVARALVSRRDQLVEQLPRELATARGLSLDQRELVVDEAIDYMVTEYGKAIPDREALERAFWATAAFRVKRVHEGRGATVRAGWRRVDVDGLEIAAGEPDPAAAVVRQVERHVLLEFAATLTDTQRQVLAAKFADGPREQGRVVVSRRLGLSISEVRKAERAIARKLDRFVAIVSAGTLCDHRGQAIAALAVGSADQQQEVAARLHLRYCPACRAGYAEQLRALRAGELQHRIAQLLLPLPAIEERRRRGPGAWDAVADWASRPFGSESATTGIQLAAGARGLGTVAAAKLATLCIGGVVAVGGGTYCVTNLLGSEPKAPKPREARQAPAKRADEEPAAAYRVVVAEKGRRPATAPAQPRKVRRQRATSAARGDPATQHERDVPISPPITDTSGAPVQEFGPGPAESAPASPAGAPSTGGPEFP